MNRQQEVWSLGRRSGLCAPSPPSRPSSILPFSYPIVLRPLLCIPRCLRLPLSFLNVVSNSTILSSLSTDPPCHPSSVPLTKNPHLILAFSSFFPLSLFRFSSSLSSSSFSSSVGDAWSFILRRLDPPPFHPSDIATPSSLIPVERATSKDHHQDFRKNS